MDICVTYLIEWTSFFPWNPVKTPIYNLMKRDENPVKTL